MRDRVARIIANRPGLRAVDRAVADEGWRVIALLRLSPLVPFNLLDLAAGLSGMRWRGYAIATAVVTIAQQMVGAADETLLRQAELTRVAIGDVPDPDTVDDLN